MHGSDSYILAVRRANEIVASLQAAMVNVGAYAARVTSARASTTAASVGLLAPNEEVLVQQRARALKVSRPSRRQCALQQLEFVFCGRSRCCRCCRWVGGKVRLSPSVNPACSGSVFTAEGSRRCIPRQEQRAGRPPPPGLPPFTVSRTFLPHVDCGPLRMALRA